MRFFFFLLFTSLLFPTHIFAAEISDCDLNTRQCFCPDGVSDTQYNNYRIIAKGSLLAPDLQECEADCRLLSGTYDNVHSWSFQCRVDGAVETIGQGVLLPLQVPQAEHEDVIPTLGVDIPGFDEAALERGRGTNENANLLGVYIEAVYNWLLIAGAIVAILMMMIGGLQYALARGDAGRIGQAKERITNAVFGMVLLLGAYTIAAFINPDTVRFESLDIAAIERRQYFPPAGEDLAITPRFDIDPNYTEITGDGLLVTTSEKRINQALLPSLQAASEDFFKKTGERIKLTSGFRDPAKQATLFYDNCIATGGVCKPPTCNIAPTSLVKKDGGRFVLTGQLAGARDRATIISTIAANAVPSQCPHTSSIAFDAWHEKSPGDFQADPNLMRQLAESMAKNGFCRLGAEVWHFEWNDKRVSSNCKLTNIAPTYTVGGKTYTPDADCKIWNFRDHKCVR